MPLFKTNEAVKMYKRGKSPVSIAIYFGVPIATVNRAIRELRDETIVQEYQDGVPVKEIIKRHLTSGRTLYKILKQRGIGFRNNGVD
jgi:Mor family transcriptional regulator